MLAMMLVVVAALGAGGYAVFTLVHGGPSSSTADLQHSSAAAPVRTASPAASLGRWGHIETRAEDPLPLTVAQLYPSQFISGGTVYTRTATRRGAQCADAVFGSRLISAVAGSGCSQVIRASYLSAAKLMGTIGVLNLKTSAAAERTGKATGPSRTIVQVPGASGPTRDLSKGTGLEEAEVKGHYLILVWAEFTSLRAPRNAKQRTELETFISQVIQETANVSLTSRMVTGNPSTP
jgi:hypothetical protein